MKIVRESTNNSGRRVVTVELAQGESLIAIRNNSYYRLAESLQDQVMHSDYLTGIEEVCWCSVEQKWVS